MNHARDLVPVQKYSGELILGHNDNTKMATSVSGDRMTTALEPFLAARTVCSSSLVSASSCVHSSDGSSTAWVIKPSELVRQLQITPCVTKSWRLCKDGAYSALFRSLDKKETSSVLLEFADK